MSSITLNLRLVSTPDAKRLTTALARPNLSPPDNRPFTPTPAGRKLEQEVRRLFKTATPSNSPCQYRYQAADSVRGPILHQLLGNGQFKSREIDLPAPSVIWIPPPEMSAFATSLKRRRSAPDHQIRAIIHLTLHAATWATSLPGFGLLLCINVAPSPARR